LHRRGPGIFIGNPAHFITERPGLDEWLV